MENPQRPQLSDLRQKRLAFFGQRHVPSPPTEPKPNPTPSGKAPASTRPSTRNKDPPHAAYDTVGVPHGSGAIPKSYAHRRAHSNLQRRNGSHDANSGGSNRFSYELVADKKRSTHQRLSSQEFEIHTGSSEVDKLFQSSQVRATKSQPTGKDWGDTSGRRCSPAEAHPSPSRPEDSASYDYEQHLIRHLQRPDRFHINNQIKNEVASAGGSPRGEHQRERSSGDSRERHLKRFLYQEDRAASHALKAASDHDAAYADQILHQMGKVQTLRAQVHGELISGFTDKEFKLSPVRPMSNGQDLPNAGSQQEYPYPSKQDDRHLSHSPDNLQESSIRTDMPGVGMNSQGDPSSMDFSPSSSVREDLADDRPACQEVESEPDDAEMESQFDLGALQMAAEKGDDILRQYIQSLSVNLKRKKQGGSLVRNDDVSNVEREVRKQYPEQDPETSKKSSQEDRKGVAGRHQPEAKTNRHQDEESTSMYKPKVRQPTVTSLELESLGLFTDLSKRRPPSPKCDDANGLQLLPESADAKANGDLEAESPDHLGLRTHRPQQRSFTPFQQVLYQPSENQEEHLENLSDEESPERTQKHHSYQEGSESQLYKSKEPFSEEAEGGYDDITSHGKRADINTEADCYSLAADVSLVQDDMRNLAINHMQAQTAEERSKIKSPPSYEKLFPSPRAVDSKPVPLPHPWGTEIGNFISSEQSTDSDPSRQHTADKPDHIPPQKENRIRRKPVPKPRTSIIKGKTPRRPKTPERHADAVREHHERERETRRQLSSRKSKSPETERRSHSQSQRQPAGQAALSSRRETNNRLAGNDESRKGDAATEEGACQASAHKEPHREPLVGPAGDAPGDLSENLKNNLCSECSNLISPHLPECNFCGAVVPSVSRSTASLDIPPLEGNLRALSPRGEDSGRSHLTTGSAWDIAISSQRDEADALLKGEDTESTVFGKISSFLPKLSNDGGPHSPSKVDQDHGASGNGVENEEGGPGHGITDLSKRVDAWLNDNETGRRSRKSEGLPEQVPPPDRPPASEEEEAEEPRVTFEVPAGEDPSAGPLGSQGEGSRAGGHRGRMKPRPSSAGPERSRQAGARPKSGLSRSRTGQMIDGPMFNRRWATSSSAWGSRRSTSDGLQLSGQRASAPDAAATPASDSPVLPRKRPASAKPRAPRTEAEPRVRGQRARPLSASVKARESRDSKRGGSQKDGFLTVNSAQVEEGPTAKSLNASHTVMPLTLQLMCDSPRGGEGLSLWELLPDEILLHAFSFLSHQDLALCAASCSRFHCIAMDDSLWRTIKLHKRRVTDFALSQIGERRPARLSITQCHGNIVTENGLRNLFRSCADTLQDLNVSGCTGGELTGDSLLLHVSRCRHLVSLDASWCQVTDNGLSAVTDSCQRLTTLCLNGSPSVSDECLSKVIRKQGRSLRVLEVLGCLQLSSGTLVLIGSECHYLHTLNIGQCYKVTDESISQIVPHLKNLKHFDLRGCKQIRDTCVRKIVRHCKQLVTLVVANCAHLTNAAIVEIATYLPSLRCLDVSGCKKVTNEGVRALATCCHHLTSLDVSSTAIDHRSVSALASYCNKTLVSVRLNCCKDITETAIVKLLKNCKKLQSLHLYGVKGLRNLGVLKLQYSCLQFG